MTCGDNDEYLKVALAQEKPIWPEIASFVVGVSQTAVNECGVHTLFSREIGPNNKRYSYISRLFYIRLSASLFGLVRKFRWRNSLLRSSQRSNSRYWTSKGNNSRSLRVAAIFSFSEICVSDFSHVELEPRQTVIVSDDASIAHKVYSQQRQRFEVCNFFLLQYVQVNLIHII